MAPTVTSKRWGRRQRGAGHLLGNRECLVTSQERALPHPLPPSLCAETPWSQPDFQTSGLKTRFLLGEPRSLTEQDSRPPPLPVRPPALLHSDDVSVTAEHQAQGAGCCAAANCFQSRLQGMCVQRGGPCPALGSHGGLGVSTPGRVLRGSEEGRGGGRKGGEPRRRVDFLKVGGMETLSHTENEGQ